MNEPGNPLFGGATDPLSGMEKIVTPATDPLSGMEKIVTPATDPLSGMEKIVTPATDQLSGQMKWAPAATDPVSGQPNVKPPNPNFLPAVQRMGRGVRNTIIIVCIIAVLLLGGGFVFLSAHPGTTGSNTIGGQPGVIQWQKQIQVYTSAKEQKTTSGNAFCAADGSQGTLDERLVGGGFTADDDHGNLVAAQSAYPHGNGDWYGNFLPQKQAHTATVIAVCLRKPAAFFNGLSSFDSVQSHPMKASHNDGAQTSAVAVAVCPTGEAILGGGYLSEYSGGGVYSIDASYPAYANGVGEWNVAFHVDPTNGLQRVQVTAYAICAKGLTTHLEHKAIAGIATRKNPYTQDSLTCASGELLTGGYQITAPPSLVGVNDDSPLNDTTRSEANGSVVQNWYVAVASSGWQAHVSPGQLWVTCLDAPGSATPTTQPTATAHAPRPTSTPKPRPTATPRPKPTSTPVASCVSLYSGTGTMNVDKAYLNVDKNGSEGIGISSTGAQAQWDTITKISPVNGALFANMGTIGSSGFNSVTCAKLRSASYSTHPVSVVNGEVFLVKTPGGHYARVLITTGTPGALGPTLTWRTYKP